MTGTEATTYGSTRRRIGRIGTYGVAASAAIFVALLFAVPTAAAAPMAQAVVLSAPYHGTVTSYTNSWSTAGCGSAAILTRPFFHPTTGLAGWSDQAKGPACTKNPLGASGEASSGFFTLFPLTLSKHSVTIVVVISIQAELQARDSAVTCVPSALNASCYSEAYAGISGDAYLYDQTIGAYWFPTTFWTGAFVQAYNYTTCYSGSCSSFGAPSESMQVHTTAALTIPATRLHPSDSFYLYVFFSGTVIASVGVDAASISGGSTSALLNVATNGNGIDIASITIT